VRNTVLATAVAAALALAAPQADAQSASKAEVQAMKAQLEALAERLGRLEAQNATLQTENETLKSAVDRRDAEMDYLKSQTKELREEGAVAANEIGKVKGADWATKIKARGDIRYRSENIWTERVAGSGSTAVVEDAADRYRHRVRARLGFDAKVTDTVKATLLLATGGDDPRSSNQTLGSQSSRKSIGLDMGYIDWNFMSGANAVLGKQAWPQWRPGTSMFYDGDYNPEGGSVKYEQGMLFGSAYGWWLSEQWNANDQGENSDGNVVGAQLGLKFPLLGGETRVAVNYSDCGACQDQTSILYANNGNGNTTYRVPVTTTVGQTNTTPAVTVVNTTQANYLRYDYEILELAAETGTTLFDLPFSVWAHYANNLADDVEYDTAYAVGASLGRASNPKTWLAAVWYENRDADALFGQFVDSDFGDGRTDSEGFVFRGAYAPVRNFNVTGTYFLNTINKDRAPVTGTGFAIGEDLDYDRLQLDLNYRF